MRQKDSQAQDLARGKQREWSWEQRTPLPETVTCLGVFIHKVSTPSYSSTLNPQAFKSSPQLPQLLTAYSLLKYCQPSTGWRRKKTKQQFLLPQKLGGEGPVSSTPTDFLHCSQSIVSTTILCRSEAQLKIWNVLVQSIQHPPKKLLNSTHQPPHACASNVRATATQTNYWSLQIQVSKRSQHQVAPVNSPQTIYQNSAFLISPSVREKKRQTTR